MLISRMFVKSNCELLPYLQNTKTEEVQLQELHAGPDIPDGDQFPRYCADTHIEGIYLHFYFKIASREHSFYYIKGQLFNWITTNEIWINESKLDTTHNMTIGWLTHIHPRLSNRTTINDERSDRMTTTIPLSLYQRTIQSNNG